MSFRLPAVAFAATLLGAAGAEATPCESAADPGFFNYSLGGDCVVFDTTDNQFEIEGWYHRDTGELNHIFTESFFIALGDGESFEFFDVGEFELIGNDIDIAIGFTYQRTFGEDFVMTVGLTFLLTPADALGAAVSILDERVNVSIEPLRGDLAPPEIALVTYTDFDLNETPDDDLTLPVPGPFYLQIDGTETVAAVIGDPFEDLMTPPDAFEVRRCNAALGEDCELLEGLQNDTLSDLLGFVDVDGDLTHAMAHVIPIDEGGSGREIRIRKILAVLPAPEPATFGLIGLGLAGLGWARRRAA